ncbi:hypothetical protein [Brevibacillus daliensis]|uniref:hypothetical protein n=1 Tax=Brevibacillus daliensis TaxID=2892995 RepID=UPI001E2FAB1D|nr:hypothetical protein [Brevibacillus daliensis]
MDLTSKEPADIWRLLIPRKQWLFSEDVDPRELIFSYRDKVFVVSEDGSVVSLPKPQHLKKMNVIQLLDLLADEWGTFDYDDHGIFDVGGVLKEMGYIAPTGRNKEDYRIEISNTLDPGMMITTYELKGVSFRFALYHGVLFCHELNQKSDGLYEYEVKQIIKLGEEQVETFQYLH